MLASAEAVKKAEEDLDALFEEQRDNPLEYEAIARQRSAAKLILARVQRRNASAPAARTFTPNSACGRTPIVHPSGRDLTVRFSRGRVQRPVRAGRRPVRLRRQHGVWVVS